jgi:hypothetical protein
LLLVVLVVLEVVAALLHLQEVQALLDREMLALLALQI